MDAAVVDDDGPVSLNFKFVYQYKASAYNIGVYVVRDSQEGDTKRVWCLVVYCGQGRQ